jgi:hypothetical protein
MKKLFILTAALFITTSVAMSQEPVTETPVEPIREQVETPEAASHGQAVSVIARETQSGEAVSQQARTKGESKRADKLNRRDDKRQDGARMRPERPSRPENVRPERPERPTRPERPATPVNPGRP